MCIFYHSLELKEVNDEKYPDEADGVTSHYLPAEAISFIGSISVRRPIGSAIGVLLLFSCSMAFLKKKFGRGGSDIFIAALFFTGITIFVAACLYLLYHERGYRVFHPLF